ncbi:hypothetical protein MSAN_01898700 [Mycena sanguinolenta]|uniref:Uncharacterized protein n=1 Tax=Mycena sanguinolenta TaxID=230812 RepID=A0A8H7CR71_9AGAR|nr:hypothetical protein MSAN_01898700 [Mycena sanguinolenta]
MLLENGADVNASGGAYGSALHAATVGGHTETVSMLLENSADINAEGKYGSVLGAAVAQHNLEMVHLLLEKGADVNMAGGKYGSVLAAAASEGALDIVNLLLEYGADTNMIGRQYGSALRAAASPNNKWGIQSFLLGATGAEAHVASKTDRIETILSLFSIPPDDFSITFGFEESLIMAGDVLLEQVLIHCPKLLDLNSQKIATLLALLGQEFSPYPGVVITPSASYSTPVFQTNGDVWDLEELVSSRMKQIKELAIDELQGMSISTKISPLLFVNNVDQSTSGQRNLENARTRDGNSIQDSSEQDSIHGGTHSSSSGGGGHSHEGLHNNRLNLNDEPDGLNATGRSSNQEWSIDKSKAAGSGGDPSDPSASKDFPPAHFNVCAEILGPNQRENPQGKEPGKSTPVFHSIRMNGHIWTTMERYKDKYPVAKVSFSALRFQRDDLDRYCLAVKCPERAYQQFWAKVAVYSGRNHAQIQKARPMSTPTTSDGKRMDTQTAETNSSKTVAAKLAATFTAIIPWSVTPEVSGSVGYGRKDTTGSTESNLIDRIVYTEQGFGKGAQWCFYIGDKNTREIGLTVEETNRPTVEFHFPDIGDEEPPSHVTLSLLSLWKKPEGKMSKLEPPFHNVCHLVKFKLPSDLSELYQYMHTIKADLKEVRENIFGFGPTDFKHQIQFKSDKDDEPDPDLCNFQPAKQSTSLHRTQTSDKSAQMDGHKEESEQGLVGSQAGEENKVDQNCCPPRLRPGLFQLCSAPGLAFGTPVVLTDPSLRDDETRLVCHRVLLLASSSPSQYRCSTTRVTLHLFRPSPGYAALRMYALLDAVPTPTMECRIPRPKTHCKAETCVRAHLGPGDMLRVCGCYILRVRTNPQPPGPVVQASRLEPGGMDGIRD